MAATDITAAIARFLGELAIDPVEDRIVEYVLREVRNGRRLADALCDPYVKNRLSEDKVAKVLENPEVIAAIEQRIASAFGTRDFGFS